MQRRNTKIRSLCFLLPSFFLFIHPSIYPSFYPFVHLSILPSILQTLTQGLPYIREIELNEIAMAPVLRAFTISAWQTEGSGKSQETRKILEISCDMEYTCSGPLPFVLETNVKIANFKSTRLNSRVHSGKVGVTMMDKSCWY